MYYSCDDCNHVTFFFVSLEAGMMSEASGSAGPSRVIKEGWLLKRGIYVGNVIASINDFTEIACVSFIYKYV